ncbi:DNA replication and repair protein RecF [Patescibacteria group bacterium]|nr:DNA replication and repair protein RecF [Patescibacteria group bacterium]
MILRRLSLQNFRSYKKQTFDLDKETTLIVGPNTSGKSNFIESIFLLSTGKSFRAEKDDQLIGFSEDIARVKGIAENIKKEETELEVVLTRGEIEGQKTQSKKFLVNGVPRRRSDFAGNLPAVLFSPQDLDIIIESPSLRRRFLDNVLDQIDKDYRVASTAYSKALRQRNALLEVARETGTRNEKQFEYWNHLVIENGGIITKKRQEFLDYVNNATKDIFDFVINYDKSVISPARLEQYSEAEIGAGVTLVGPHRDDFNISMFDDVNNSTHDVKLFGSRGQQRLAILQLKILELSYFEEKLGKKPILLLDDIFSELDEEHINLILEKTNLTSNSSTNQQIIITTAHQELIPTKIANKMKIINFKK